MAYVAVAVLLLVPFIILLVHRRLDVKRIFTARRITAPASASSSKRSPRAVILWASRLSNWSLSRVSYKELLDGEFCLKIFLASFTALSIGVIVALTALSYGTAWVAAELILITPLIILLAKAVGSDPRTK
jgi:hypothetical protein